MVKGVLHVEDSHSVKFSDHLCALTMCQEKRESTPSLKAFRVWVEVKVETAHQCNFRLMWCLLWYPCYPVCWVLSRLFPFTFRTTLWDEQGGPVTQRERLRHRAVKSRVQTHSSSDSSPGLSQLSSHCALAALCFVLACLP